jgi:hypothetical protein
MKKVFHHLIKMALVIELVIELVRQQRTNRVKGNC